jgi:N-acetylmuramic acid 6-phosphate etherase
MEQDWMIDGNIVSEEERVPAEPEDDALLTSPPAGSRTEARNGRTVDIDLVSTEEVLRLLNAEEATVAGAVAPVLPVLATVVDQVVERLRAGGRVHYFGAGTSGRMGAADAAEVIPTFGLEPGIFVAHQAGGD